MAELITDPALIAARFRPDRGVHIYALADLEPPFWEISSWYRRGDAIVGLVSLPDDEGAVVYAVSTADPEGSLALVIDLLDQIPAGQLITGPVGLAEAIAPHRTIEWSGPHLRYELTDRGHLESPATAVVPLSIADLGELQSLYDTEPRAAFFLPHMLGDDTFVGVRVDGRLVAAAGTHVVSAEHGVAAVGAVYTHPDHRGQGLGAAVTAGVIDRLGSRVDTIGLNVSEANAAARTVYERLGFTPILRYEECELA